MQQHEPPQLCPASTWLINVFRCVNITNSGAESLARLRTLQSLDLSDCNVGDTGLQRVLTGLPVLQHLSLQHCAHITDMGTLPACSTCFAPCCCFLARYVAITPLHD